MREYSIPALVDIPDSASLTDVVFTRAAPNPHAVVMPPQDRRRPVGGRDRGAVP